MGFTVMSKGVAAGGILALIFGFFSFFNRREPAAAPTARPVTISKPRVVSSVAAKPTVSADVDLLARTIWGEARGEGAAGMRAVASVIMNRVKSPRFPSTVSGVILQPWQFSMWNEGEPNGAKARRVTATDPAFAQALSIAAKAVSGGLPDPTGGALHYYAKWLSSPPYWAKGAHESAHIGRHIFLTGVS